MTNKEIVTKIIQAIEKLKKETPPLEFGSVHERSTAHRLAVHLDALFPNLNVDCEYDRKGTVQKELADINECSEERATDRILPDIIVHKRLSEENLLVIELKKNNDGDKCDIKKLELLTDEDGSYDYQLGLYLNINNGEFNRNWFKNGSSIKEQALYE